MNSLMMLISSSSDNFMYSGNRAGYFDGEYILAYFLCIAAMIFATTCSSKVNSTFAKYDKVYSRKGIQAWQVARQILDSNGLHDVTVVPISGHLTDNFNPKTRVVSLSESVYSSTSLAAIGVAAHECGHAVQHAKGYFPILVRTAIVPLANIGSRAYIYIFFLGLLLGFGLLVDIGIWLFVFVVLFQLVTLPVEFNASSRAIRTLEEQQILASDEIPYAKKTLRAAAMTYVASLVVSITQLMRLLARSRSNRR